MSSLANHAEDLLLKWLLTATTATRPSARYISLHTGDPGEARSANELVVGTDADYVRKVVTFADPVTGSGQSLSSSAVSWTAASGASYYTVTHLAIWDALTGGNCLMKAALLAPRNMTASAVLDFATGELIASLD